MSADDNKLYKTLGINPDATKDEIKKAYRRLSILNHPDKDGGDADKFAEISKAYKTLVNPETRETYDSSNQLEIMAKQNIRQAMIGFVNECIKADENPMQPVLFSSLVEHFKNTLQQDRNTLDQVMKKQDRMLKMPNRVKLKHCDDVYKEVVRSVSVGLKHDADVLLNNIELLEKINELLADYETDEKNPREFISFGQERDTGILGMGGLF